MFIHSLSLKNIRSYESTHISFEKGTTLLTGDIGSGKTSLLLALEFALFGILRGKTSPSEFLAHHANEGSVTLRCTINNQEITITRGLKKTSAGIVQTPGELSIAGQKETLVATELKARILSLLGYPESLIAKSPNLFRYTVFTPQEQVKTILFESTEERKDIIRKIFSLDTYKLVADNTQYYLASLRERTEYLKGQTDNVSVLREQLVSSKKRQEEFQAQLPLLLQELQLAEDNYKKAKQALETVQEQANARKELQKKQELLAREISATTEKIIIYQEQAKTFEEKIAVHKQETILFDEAGEEKVKTQLQAIAEKKSILQQKYGQVAQSNKQAANLISQIQNLATCPICRQDVKEDHKQHISVEQQTLIDANTLRENKLQELETSILQKEAELLLKQEAFTKLRQQQLLANRQQQEILTIQDALAKNKRLQEQLTTQIATLQNQQEKIILELSQTKNVSADKEKLFVETTERQLRETTARHREKKAQATIIAEQTLALEKTIQEKQAIEQEIKKLATIRNWLNELFIPLVKSIEKNVLLKIYQEFNQYFSQWFDALLADDTISVRLDEDFTPQITQHGYDTHILNLSGGEKTSVALAYRLALHKVLNDYFSSLHTKGLLILDEPTDGFSTEQLDRLRDVLEQVNVTQLIIVSHEQKLESLAEHIIRVQKNGQFSQIQTI